MEFAEIENKIAQETARKHPKESAPVNGVLSLLMEFRPSGRGEYWLILSYWNQIGSFSLLAYIAALRLHFAQAGWCLRSLLEAGPKAAYCISHEDALTAAIKRTENDQVYEKNNFKRKCHHWVETEYSEYSRDLLEKKSLINKFCTHSGFLTVGSMSESKAGYRLSCFDLEEPWLIRLMLFLISDSVLKILKILANEANAAGHSQATAFYEHFNSCRDQIEGLVEGLVRDPRCAKFLRQNGHAVLRDHRSPESERE